MTEYETIGCRRCGQHRTDQNRMRRSDQLQQTLSARSFLSENTTSNTATGNNESRRGRPRITASPSAGASAGATASAVQVKTPNISHSQPELLLIIMFRTVARKSVAPSVHIVSKRRPSRISEPESQTWKTPSTRCQLSRTICMMP